MMRICPTFLSEICISARGRLIAAPTIEPPISDLFHSPNSAIIVRHAGEPGLGVDGGAVDADLKVAVGAGGVAGGAEIADRLARADAVPDRDGEAGHMAVERRIAVAVVDNDAVAVAAVVLGQDHRARGRGHDRAAVQAVAVDVDTGVEMTRAVLAVNAGDQVLGRHRPAEGAVEVVALLLSMDTSVTTGSL